MDLNNQIQLVNDPIVKKIQTLSTTKLCIVII